MDTVEFSAEGRLRVALNRAVGEIEPVLVMVRVLPDFENEAPLPLVNEKFPRTPFESVTLIWLPLMVMVGAEPEERLVKLGIFIALWTLETMLLYLSAKPDTLDRKSVV